MGKSPWFATLPLNDERDLLARVGFRFVWGTGPYLLLMALFDWNGLESSERFRSLDLFVIAIPMIGGLLDWIRLQNRSVSESTTHPTA